MAVAEKKRFNVMEIRCRKIMCGVTRIDPVIHVEVQRRTGVTRELCCRAEQTVLRLVKRIVGERCEVERKTNNGMDEHEQCEKSVT